jgi:hypothetical protein
MTTLRQSITAAIEAKQVEINKASAELNALQQKLTVADAEFQQFLENDVDKLRGWFVNVADHLKNLVENA